MTLWAPGLAVHLETERFRLRTLARADASQRFLDWSADVEIKRNLNLGPRRLTADELCRYIEDFDNQTRFLLGIFDKANDLHIGIYAVYFDPLHAAAETIVVIGDRDYWGKKVVIETRSALIEFLFERVGIEKVWGRPLARNFAAVYNYRALGFTCEGVLHKQLRAPDGTRVDQYFFGLLRDDWRARKPKTGS